MLLRQSSATGGGDYYHRGGRTIEIGPEANASAETVMHEIFKGVAMEGQPITPAPDTTVGRWAGDRVALVGDYDESKLWEQLPSWKNISDKVVRDWNDFIELKAMKLKHNPDCSCNKSPVASG